MSIDQAAERIRTADPFITSEAGRPPGTQETPAREGSENSPTRTFQTPPSAPRVRSEFARPGTLDEHAAHVAEMHSRMLGLYFRWKLFPADTTWGPRFAEAARDARNAIRDGRRAGLTDHQLSVALHLPSGFAGAWADILVMADRSPAHGAYA